MIACNRKPYVSQKLKFEKLSDSCNQSQSSFRMVSNIAGERYEFDECLPVNFTKEQMKVSRQGDTVLVRFEKPKGKKRNLYKITLDIDSYPKYNFITVGDNTYIVVSSHD